MTEFKYLNESKADNALKYWGDFIIKSKKIQYIAVVKKNRFQFCLEIGKQHRETFKINDYIVGKINSLTFIEVKNLYETAPIPIRRLIRRIKNFKSRELLTEKHKKQHFINTIKKTSLFIRSKEVSKFVMDDYDQKKPEHIEFKRNNDFDHISGGNAISFKKNKFGTLGGIFKLKKFPKEFFGISNWHVIALNEICGQQLYLQVKKGNQTSTYEYGNLSWWCRDDLREVGFVHFPNLTSEKVRKKNICGYNHSGKLGSPKINLEVMKCGKTTNCNCDDKKCLKGIIYSANATVKVNSNSRNDNIPFKNQILIKNKKPILDSPFSMDGDSGSIVVNDDYDIVGLLFGKTEGENASTGNDNTFYVANNINNIFNKTFKKPQCIMINKRKETLHSFDLCEFI